MVVLNVTMQGMNPSEDWGKKLDCMKFNLRKGTSIMVIFVNSLPKGELMIVVDVNNHPNGDILSTVAIIIQEPIRIGCIRMADLI